MPTLVLNDIFSCFLSQMLNLPNLLYTIKIYNIKITYHSSIIKYLTLHSYNSILNHSLLKREKKKKKKKTLMNMATILDLIKLAYTERE